MSSAILVTPARAFCYTSLMSYRSQAAARPPRAWFVVLALSAASLQAQDHPYAREDPEKIVTAEACGECHVSEAEVWKKTPHATGFKTLHRLESAEAIAGRLGFRLMKRDSLCLSCHYTPTLQSGQLRAVAGVSCESCHGAGADWIDVHNDYGGKGLDHTTETPEHRARRIEESRDKGMRRSSDLYGVVKSCYGCHLVPEEQLVNVGQHSIGSGDFDFVRWQEQIRHNFLDSFLNGDGTDNAERPIDRRRVMYAVGRAVELESSLRGVAAAEGEGVYLKAMLRRVRLALGAVREIAEETAIPEMKEAVALVRGVSVSLGQQDALNRTADAIGELAQRFAAGADGTQLARLDPLLEGKRIAEPLPPPAGGRATVAEAGSAEGRHPTIGPGACSGCHGPQNQWWFADNHFKSADPFFDQDPKNVEIARRYGISEDDMARGTAVCMTCHATVVTGREQRDVQDGVGCENCHGSAGDYLEPHKEGDKILGLERPGYRNALTLGMVELKDLEVRASNCTSCHYVTDRKLLAAGHPSGEGFDFVAGMSKVRHWEDPPVPAETLQAAFRTVLDARGPVPQVEVTELPPPSPPPEEEAVAETSPEVSTPAAQPAARKTPRLAGEVKTRIRKASQFATIGPGSCSGCHRHKSQSEWWIADAHYRAADPFFEESSRHQKIARLYGISSKEMTRGTTVCMDCHGTIVTGREKRNVAEGVSCESCHGAAADYLEPHQEGDEALGLERPGYVKALTLGMKELRRPDVRAGNCTECHYVTEPRLLAAGHPSGADFDYMAGMSKVKHWEHADDTAVLTAAFAFELKKRGKVPRIERAAGGDRPTPTFTSPVPRPYEAPEGAEGEITSELGLTPFPQIDGSTPVEDILLLLKKRMELLYRKVHETPGEPP